MSKQLKYTLTASILGVGLSVSAAANAQWNGFYVDGGIGAAAATAEVTNNFNTAGASLQTETDNGKNNFTLSLGGGWRMDGGQWVLGLGAFYDPVRLDITEDKVAVPGASINTKIEQKSRYGLRADLGWKLAPPTVGYVLISWNWAEVEVRQDAGGLNQTQKETHSGFGYGAGIRHLLPGNWYLYAEFQQVDYNSKNYLGTNVSQAEVKPHDTIGLIGAGFKF